nr:Cas9 endonuclease PAM-interacting domain-containing protein [uncultured Blautia sp.]
MGRWKRYCESKKTLTKNSVHYTRYAFERKGSLFDQQPLRAASGLIERKVGLDTEKYGGYNKSTASYFLLIKYIEAGKKPKQDVMFVPIDLMESERIMDNEIYAKDYVRNAIAQIIGKPRDVVQEVSFPLGMRKIKVNTLLTFDGFEATLASKSNGGKTLVFGSMMPLFVDDKKESYIKRLESFAKKKKQNNSLLVDEVYDKITKEENRELFLFLTKKVKEMPYCLIFGSQLQVLHDKENEFENLKLEQQVETLLNVLSIFKTGRTTGCDLKALGGAGQAGIFTESSKLSNWKKSYKDVRIVDISAAGLHRKISQNLLELL